MSDSKQCLLLLLVAFLGTAYTQIDNRTCTFPELLPTSNSLRDEVPLAVLYIYTQPFTCSGQLLEAEFCYRLSSTANNDTLYPALDLFLLTGGIVYSKATLSASVATANCTGTGVVDCCSQVEFGEDLYIGPNDSLGVLSQGTDVRPLLTSINVTGFELSAAGKNYTVGDNVSTEMATEMAVRIVDLSLTVGEVMPHPSPPVAPSTTMRVIQLSSSVDLEVLLTHSTETGVSSQLVSYMQSSTPTLGHTPTKKPPVRGKFTPFLYLGVGIGIGLLVALTGIGIVVICVCCTKRMANRKRRRSEIIQLQNAITSIPPGLSSLVKRHQRTNVDQSDIEMNCLEINANSAYDVGVDVETQLRRDLPAADPNAEKINGISNILNSLDSMNSVDSDGCEKFADLEHAHETGTTSTTVGSP